MKKADIVLIVGLVALAIVLAVTVARPSDYAADAKVVVSVGGKIYGTYLLAESQEIVIQEDFYNKITVEKDSAGNMQVSVREADCPGLDCVRHAPIRLKGQHIVCLPNKMVVEIRDGEGTIDAYTY